MTVRFTREVEKLKKKILAMSAVVEESLEQAVEAIENRDAELAAQVARTEGEIDQMDVDVEEECLKILALYQPVAIDLRFIVAVLKINYDLERISDLALNIAKRVGFLRDLPVIEAPFDLHGMATRTRAMLKDSLDALVNLDARLARAVLQADFEVDAIHRRMYDQVKAAIRTRPEHLDILIHYLTVSRFLERIADHTTNISEDIIYMVEGTIVRHHASENQVPRTADED